MYLADFKASELFLLLSENVACVKLFPIIAFLRLYVNFAMHPIKLSSTCHQIKWCQDIGILLRSFVRIYFCVHVSQWEQKSASVCNTQWCESRSNASICILPNWRTQTHSPRPGIGPIATLGMIKGMWQKFENSVMLIFQIIFWSLNHAPIHAVFTYGSVRICEKQLNHESYVIGFRLDFSKLIKSSRFSS